MMDIVAEMMIWANSAVAARIAATFPGAALLRNHPPPRAEAFEQVGCRAWSGPLREPIRSLSGGAHGQRVGPHPCPLYS